MSVTPVHNSSFLNYGLSIPSSMGKIALRIVNFLYANSFLLFSYKRNYYNLTGSFFSIKSASPEEIFVNSFFKSISERAALKEVKALVSTLKSHYFKNTRCVLLQALKMYGVDSSIRTYLQNEVAALKGGQNEYFIATKTNSNYFTYATIGIVAVGAALLVGSLLYFNGYLSSGSNSPLTTQEIITVTEGHAQNALDQTFVPSVNPGSQTLSSSSATPSPSFCGVGSSFFDALKSGVRAALPAHATSLVSEASDAAAQTAEHVESAAATTQTVVTLTQEGARSVEHVAAASAALQSQSPSVLSDQQEVSKSVQEGFSFVKGIGYAAVAVPSLLIGMGCWCRRGRKTVSSDSSPASTNQQAGEGVDSQKRHSQVNKNVTTSTAVSTATNRTQSSSTSTTANSSSSTTSTPAATTTTPKPPEQNEPKAITSPTATTAVKKSKNATNNTQSYTTTTTTTTTPMPTPTTTANLRPNTAISGTGIYYDRTCVVPNNTGDPTNPLWLEQFTKPSKREWSTTQGDIMSGLVKVDSVDHLTINGEPAIYYVICHAGMHTDFVHSNVAIAMLAKSRKQDLLLHLSKVKDADQAVCKAVFARQGLQYNIKSTDGKTLLDLACESGSKYVVEGLLAVPERLESQKLNGEENTVFLLRHIDQVLSKEAPSMGVFEKLFKKLLQCPANDKEKILNDMLHRLLADKKYFNCLGIFLDNYKIPVPKSFDEYTTTTKEYDVLSRLCDHFFKRKQYFLADQKTPILKHLIEGDYFGPELLDYLESLAPHKKTRDHLKEALFAQQDESQRTVLSWLIQNNKIELLEWTILNLPNLKFTEADLKVIQPFLIKNFYKLSKECQSKILENYVQIIPKELPLLSRALRSDNVDEYTALLSREEFQKDPARSALIRETFEKIYAHSKVFEVLVHKILPSEGIDLSSINIFRILEQISEKNKSVVLDFVQCLVSKGQNNIVSKDSYNGQTFFFYFIEKKKYEEAFEMLKYYKLPQALEIFTTYCHRSSNPTQSRILFCELWGAVGELKPIDKDAISSVFSRWIKIFLSQADTRKLIFESEEDNYGALRAFLRYRKDDLSQEVKTEDVIPDRFWTTKRFPYEPMSAS